MPLVALLVVAGLFALFWAIGLAFRILGVAIHVLLLLAILAVVGAFILR
jgi:hypothetical protein